MNRMNKRHYTYLAALYLLLGCSKGYVALFEKVAEEPRQVFTCPVSSLPEADREALERRIPIRNPRDLQQAMEDYLS